MVNQKILKFPQYANKQQIKIFTEHLNYSDKGDILTEMRFYVPNSELDNIEEEKKLEQKEAK